MKTSCVYCKTFSDYNSIHISDKRLTKDDIKGIATFVKFTFIPTIYNVCTVHFIIIVVGGSLLLVSYIEFHSCPI